MITLNIAPRASDDTVGSPVPHAPSESSVTPVWTRRAWMTTNAAALIAARLPTVSAATSRTRPRPESRHASARAIRASELAPRAWEAIAQRAVEAATAAGASYADARVTRSVQQRYRFAAPHGNFFSTDSELNGFGIRVLVDDTWGFAASPRIDADSAVQLGRKAVSQAKGNAISTPDAVSLGPPAVVQGEWATPMRIDPFSISIEQKMDSIEAWIEFSNHVGAPIDTLRSDLHCARQERVLVTSEGTRCTQRLYETGATITYTTGQFGNPISIQLDGLEPSGRGWEIFDDADVWNQILQVNTRLRKQAELQTRSRPALVGRYTVVCDGETMAALADATLGMATQLDRALGYEANASGTSFLTDPLAMLGSEHVTSPLVTFTSNRSAPTQLATVKWDDEGVVPQEAQLITNGVLTDFQTTREQAAWLAPYYARVNRPVASHGYAASEHALKVTMQHAPNFTMSPSPDAITLDRMIADIPDGIVITQGRVSTDAQARNGVLMGTMRQIKNGRLGNQLTGGAILFNTKELWKNVTLIGGTKTIGTANVSQYPFGTMFPAFNVHTKGQPPQVTSRSITAPAATLVNQAVIDLRRKA